MNVAGNWANSGAFIHNSGTVTFINNIQASVISGATTFFNFTSTTAGKQITFTAGTTQTISGTLTLAGASGNLIVLRSTVSGSQWNINPQGTRSVSFVDVKDSNNSNVTVITVANSEDSGNNTNWNLADLNISAAPSAGSDAATTAFISSQISTADILRILLPDARQLNLYQINTFIPAGGPVYLYHPLTESDIAFFEELFGRKGKI